MNYVLARICCSELARMPSSLGAAARHFVAPRKLVVDGLLDSDKAVKNIAATCLNRWRSSGSGIPSICPRKSALHIASASAIRPGWWCRTS